MPNLTTVLLRLALGHIVKLVRSYHYDNNIIIEHLVELGFERQTAVTIVWYLGEISAISIDPVGLNTALNQEHPIHPINQHRDMVQRDFKEK